MTNTIRRAALLFAGGPAPAANAVISTCAASFLRNKIEVLGILHGYSNLEKFDSSQPLQLGEAYIQLNDKVLRRTRNTQGILIGTARANPGKLISSPEHLGDPDRTKALRKVYDGLCSLGVDALVSIGGDDTLKTANKFKLFQDRLPETAKRIPVVHVPKTIDNDYEGIDFTFGFFTAVETLATEIRALLADAEATRGYFIAETMGRSAGWLSYATAIAGEATLAVSVEDIQGKFLDHEEIVDPETLQKRRRPVMKVEELVDRIVRMMVVREKRGKPFGVIVLAEGLAEFLPAARLEHITRDDHGHINVAAVQLNRLFAKLVADGYERVTGKKRKVVGLQLGYESRCAKPHSYDVLLGSQLGVGAYRALVEENKNGVMVSVSGQLDLHYVPFEQLVNQKNLVTRVRYVAPDSDFHKLVRFLETDVND